MPSISSAAVSFSQDTNLSLTGISDGDLLAASTSEADSLSFSGAEMTVTAIPDASPFILKTPTYNNALKITPSGGTATLTFNTANLSSGAITAWTLNASVSAATVAHTVSASSANSWYAIAVDGSAYNSYQTGSNGELTFTYSGGFSSSRAFTIASDTTAPTSFSLTSPVNGAILSTGLPTFTWNASTAPDLSYYALYVDGSLNTNNITSTSKTLTSSINCGAHTWYVQAVDSAGNTTNSSTFNLTIACGGGSPGGASFSLPQSRLQTIKPDGTVIYHATSTPTPVLQEKQVWGQAPTSAPIFTKALKLGQTNQEVKQLQKTLNNLGFTIAQKGPGSPGNETIYLGSLTREAVKKFQCQYGIICRGNENTTGYGALGPKTRAKLNELATTPLEPTVPIGDLPLTGPESASAVSALQKQIEELQNQLLELLNKQLKEMTAQIQN